MHETPVGQQAAPTPPPTPPPSQPQVISPVYAQNPVLVLILAILLGGVAYLTIGQWQKGLVAIFVQLWAFFVMLATCLVGFALWFPLCVVVVIDAYMQADLLKRGHPIGHWTFFGHHS